MASHPGANEGQKRGAPSAGRRTGALAYVLIAAVTSPLASGCFADIGPPANPARDSASDSVSDAAEDTPDAGADATPDLPALPTEPLIVNVLNDFQGSREVLLGAPVVRAAPLADGSTLVLSAGALLRLGERGEELARWAQASAPELADIGDISDIVPTEDGGALLLGAAGIAALAGDTVGPSPLSGHLDASALRRVLATGTIDQPEIWLASDHALLRWRAPELLRVDLQGLPTSGALLAFGAPVGDRPALWVAAGGTLLALYEHEGHLRTRVERTDLDVHDLDVDLGGRLWVIDAAGDVHQREDDGTWAWFRLPTPVRSVAAHRRADVVWFAGAETLWYFERNLFTDIGGAHGGDLAPDGSLHMDATGRAYLDADASGSPGLVRFSANRPLILAGLRSGAQLLQRDATLAIYPARPELVDRVSATLRSEDAGRTELSVASDDGIWRTTIRPTDHAPAVYELRVIASYLDDFDPAEVRTLFTIGEVAVPTWRTDVAPINERRCAECHAPTGNGTGHLRYTARGWEAEIDGILDSIRSRRMPLPPDPELTDRELAIVEAWVAGGFRE